jgi:hypothetical protein
MRSRIIKEKGWERSKLIKKEDEQDETEAGWERCMTRKDQGRKGEQKEKRGGGWKRSRISKERNEKGAGWERRRREWRRMRKAKGEKGIMRKDQDECGSGWERSQVWEERRVTICLLNCPWGILMKTPGWFINVEPLLKARESGRGGFLYVLASCHHYLLQIYRLVYTVTTQAGTWKATQFASIGLWKNMD